MLQVLQLSSPNMALSTSTSKAFSIYVIMDTNDRTQTQPRDWRLHLHEPNIRYVPSIMSRVCRC